MQLYYDLDKLMFGDKTLNQTPISASYVSYNQFTLVWNPVLSAINYKIYISENNLNFVYLDTTSATSYNFSNLTGDTSYYINIVPNILGKESITSFTTK